MDTLSAVWHLQTIRMGRKAKRRKCAIQLTVLGPPESASLPGNRTDQWGWSFRGTCPDFPRLIPAACWNRRTPPEASHCPGSGTKAYLGAGAQRRGGRTRSWRTTSASLRVSLVERRNSWFMGLNWAAWLSWGCLKPVPVRFCLRCWEGSCFLLWFFPQRGMRSLQLW